MEVTKGDGTVVTINLPSDPQYFKQVTDIVDSIAAGEVAGGGIDIMALASKYRRVGTDDLTNRIKSGKLQHEDQGNTMDTIRLIIAGSRGFTDYPMFTKTTLSVMQSLGWDPARPAEGVVIIQGEAKGPDTMAREFAIEYGIPFESYPAAWEDIAVPGVVLKVNRLGRQYNAAAGHHRNARMAETGTHLLLFWDGRSRGSDNMFKQARANALDYLVIRVDAQPTEDDDGKWPPGIPTNDLSFNKSNDSALTKLYDAAIKVTGVQDPM